VGVKDCIWLSSTQQKNRYLLEGGHALHTYELNHFNATIAEIEFSSKFVPSVRTSQAVKKAFTSRQRGFNASVKTELITFDQKDYIHEVRPQFSPDAEKG
jgi:hypothetical protein